jgi:DNA-directed RNA polymerase subunit RPC12/RpoP
MDERDAISSPVEDIVDAGSGLSQFFGTAQEVIARYTHCVICGANLHFTHITDFGRNLTQETARCPECGINARRATHRLQ